MFRIGICDDDKNVCDKLYDIISNIKDLYEAGVEIKIFYSGEELCEFIRVSEKDFDIIFLDIDFGNLVNGIFVGNTIRNKFLKNNIKIIYISSHEKYAMDLFKLQTFDFVIKPIERKVIENIISRIIKILNQQYAPFVYKVDNNPFTIDLYKILYFTSHLRKVEIFTYNNIANNVFYGKISEIGEQLKDADFFFVNRSQLVNYHNVGSFQYDKIKLVNGKELHISRNFQPKVREMYLSKIGRERE